MDIQRDENVWNRIPDASAGVGNEWEATLRANRYFEDAMAVFIEMQRMGSSSMERKSGIHIEDLLAENAVWNGLDDTSHQQAGKLIAHHFAEFAALCPIPIHIVYDYTDGDHGVYRVVYYHHQ